MQKTLSTADSLLAEFGPTMSPLDVASVLNQSPSHIRELCKKGDIPAIRLGSRWHVVTAKFAAMIDGAK